MMKQLLSGTAVALMLVANPAIAETDEDDTQDTEQMEETQTDETGSEETQTDDTEGMESDDELDPDAPMDEDEDAGAADELDDESQAGEPDEADTLAERPDETFFDQQEDQEILASELMGVNVENDEGETLGSIEDVIVDEEIGVKGVVVGVGGFLGLGQKPVAVNYDEIEHVRDDDGEVTLTFSSTVEELENAPEFTTLRDQMAEAEAEQMEQQQQQGQQMDQQSMD